MAYDLDFYAESRQHAIGHLAAQSLGAEVEAMLATAIAAMEHDGPIHVRATGTVADRQVSKGSFEVSPVNFIEAQPAEIENEASPQSWKAWLAGRRAPQEMNAAPARDGLTGKVLPDHAHAQQRAGHDVTNFTGQEQSASLDPNIKRTAAEQRAFDKAAKAEEGATFGGAPTLDRG